MPDESTGETPPPSAVRHGTDRRDLSIVIPVYNEEECLPLLEQDLARAMRDYPHPWEAILVDDGSTDGTPRAMAEICRRDPHVRAIRFRDNRGQSAAMAAGFRAARGGVVVTLDADLQNDPADIHKLLPHMREVDCVCGWREKRRDTWFRKVQSRIANGIRNRLSGETITDTGCSLKAYRADLLRRIYLFRGAHRFLPTLLRMEGATVMEVPVNHRPRAAGVAKWGMWNRVFRATYDLFGIRWMKSRVLGYEIEREFGRGLPAKAPSDMSPDEANPAPASEPARTSP
jgi:glycosyltransferase involved in cell wall biosynthesis